MSKITANKINEENKMIAVKKIIAYTISIILLCMLFVSSYYITVETGHHCSGEDCPICQEISVCVQALNSFANIVVYTASALLIVLASICLLAFINLDRAKSTLVTLKVKLLN